LHCSVFNRAEFAQAVHISVPSRWSVATVEDATLVDEDVVLCPRCPQDGSLFTDGTEANLEFKVRRNDWLAGTYSLSVTGWGSETATRLSTFTVAYKK
jgi:hypothetical protein